MNPFKDAINEAFSKHFKVRKPKRFQSLKGHMDKLTESMRRDQYEYERMYDGPLFRESEVREALMDYRYSKPSTWRCECCKHTVKIHSDYGLKNCRKCGHKFTLTNALYYGFSEQWPKTKVKDLTEVRNTGVRYVS